MKILVMVEYNIQKFISWYYKNLNVRETNHFTTSINNSPKLFRQNISDWMENYVAAFLENPFYINYKEMSFEFIINVNTNLLMETKLIGFNHKYKSSKELSQFMLNFYIPFLLKHIYEEDFDLYVLKKEDFLANSEIPFVDEFHQWLYDSKKLTLASASNYCVYLSAVKRNITFDLNYPNIFFRTINTFIEEKSFRTLDLFLGNCLKSIKNKKNQVNLHRYIAALQNYKAFFSAKSL
jgi:hypothetical protein